MNINKIQSMDVSQQNDALQLLDKVIQQNPSDDHAYLQRGKTLNQLNRKQEAINDFTKAIKTNPKNAIAFFERGAALLDLNYQKEAINDFTKSIELNPRYAFSYYKRGVALSNLNYKKEAINDFNKSIEIDPQMFDAYYSKGQTLNELGYSEAAISIFTYLLQLPIDNKICCASFCNLFKIYDKSNKQNLAYDCLKKITQKIKIFKASQPPKIISKDIKAFMDDMESNYAEYEERQTAKQSINQQQQAQSFLNEQVNYLSQKIKQYEQQQIQQTQQNKQLQDKVARIESFESNQIEINLRELEKNQNQLKYFKSFYWRLYNYLNACLYLQTGLFQCNQQAIIDSTPQQISQFVNKALNKTASIAGFIPIVGEMFGIVSSVFGFVHNEYSQKKLNERIQRLATLVLLKTTNLDIQVKKAGIQLANSQITHQLCQGQQFSNYRDQIIQTETKYKLPYAQDYYWKLGIEHCMLALITLENNFTYLQQDQERELSQMIVDAVKNPLKVQTTNPLSKSKYS